MPADDRLVVLAAVAGAHGIAGEVRLKLFAQGVASLKLHKQLMAGGRTLTLKAVRSGSNGPVACFAEIADRDAAEALRGMELAVPRAALPPLGEGEYYHADIVGLTCFSPDGAELGQVVAVENFGAGDILEIEQGGGRRSMVAFREPGACLDGERVVIDTAFLT